MARCALAGGPALAPAGLLQNEYFVDIWTFWRFPL